MTHTEECSCIACKFNSGIYKKELETANSIYRIISIFFDDYDWVINYIKITKSIDINSYESNCRVGETTLQSWIHWMEVNK